MTFQELIDEMRCHGVKRVAFHTPLRAWDMEFSELELSDTIPAPPPPEDESFEPPEEPKPAGVCKYANCGEPANSGVARGYCRPHGLKMCGVGHV